MVDIKDISGITRFSTPINEGSKRKFLLMKEDYITLKFSVDNPIYFKLGDGIDNELGVFELVDLCKPTFNPNTGGYDYELRLDAYYWKWKNKKFFFIPEQAGREASWNLTADLDTHMEIFRKSLKALGYKFRESEFVCEIGDTVETSHKLVSYDNCNLIDALTQMAETWECEWWITNHTINFGRCEYGDPVDFKVGDSADNECVNVNTMQRSDSQTNYATRIYAFGSDRNIPPTYRKKLMFDVKKVSGRDISDTGRELKSEFFPSSSYIPTELYSTMLDDYHWEKYYNSYIHRECSQFIGKNMLAGEYCISFKDSKIIVSTTQSEKLIGKLTIITKIVFDESIEPIIIQRKEVDVEDQKGITTSLDDANFALTKNSDSCKISVGLSVNFKDDRKDYAGIATTIRCTVSVQNIGISAKSSVSFLSGRNVGKTFSATYNPDFLFGDASNVIRLPEGVTASLGDMYTIDNIIKGKVPVSYFSKDDNETTINGVVQARLMLPVDVPHVDAHLDMTQEEAVEEIVVFDDVYAKYIGTTTKVPEPEWEFEKDEDDKPTENKYPIYTFKDTELTNFTEDFVLDNLRLVFQTGTLSGLDFALKLVESDNTGTTFRITRSDDYGRFLPDDTLFPQATHTEDGKEALADTYILYGFDTAFLSEDMLPNAEKELLKKAQEYVKKSQIDPSTYNCDMFCPYAYNDGNIRTFEVGDRVNLINKAYFEDGRQSRIIGYEWNLDIPYDHPIYTVGETAAYSRLGAIESKVDSLSYKGQTYSGGGSSGGGSSVYVIGVNDKTLPSDRNVFSSKRSIDEFVSKKKDDKVAGHLTLEQGATSEGLIEANGGINVTGGITTDTLTSTEIATQILKVIDKLVAKDAVFSGDISSKDYAEKLLGWIIKSSGDAEFKSIRVNGFIESDEYRRNRVSIVSGEEWNAPGGGIIESVDTESKTIRLKLEPGELATVVLDDICKGVFNNATGFQTAYFRITEKLGESSFKYVLRSGYAFHPCELMHFVAYGNFTNKDRQRSSYRTQSYTRYLINVNNWEFTKEMIAMQLGDLSNLKLFGIDMAGHSAYLRNIYMTGTIKQLSNDGVTEVPIPAFKGAWVTGKYWYYDEVTRQGSTWICIAETTLQEPGETSTDWLKYAAKGEDAITVYIHSSKGNIFQNGSVSSTLTATIMRGDTDLTESIPPSSFSWKKESNNKDTDEIFNQTHVGYGRVLELTSSDIWGRATFDCIVSL